MICVGLTTEIPVAATPSMVTPVAPVKFVPVIVIAVPPAGGPVLGETLVTLGAGGIYEKSVLAAFVPPGVVTITEAGPTVPAGIFAVITDAL